MIFVQLLFFRFLAWGLLSGDEIVVGKSRLNLPEWSSTSITAELSFSLFKFEAMKVWSSNAFRIFLPQAWHTRSENVWFLYFQSNVWTELCQSQTLYASFALQDLEKVLHWNIWIFLNSPYLIFSGQQHNLQLSSMLIIAHWTLTDYFGVSPFIAIEKDKRAWGLVLISCQTCHTFTRRFILLSSLWLAVEIETRQVVTLGFKMRWWGWQSKTPRMRAGGFYFSLGCAACSCALYAWILWLRRFCSQLDKTAMLCRLLNYNSSKKTRKQIIKTVYMKNVLFISKPPDKTI